MTRDPRLPIVEDAHARLRMWRADAPGNCIFAAVAAIRAARVRGRRLRLRAGTCFWPRRRDDGTDALFGFQWEGTLAPAVQDAVRRGKLPEVHVWADDPRRGDIVDLSTGGFPILAARLGYADWPAIPPPAWWWGSPTALPTGARYEPAGDALAMVKAFLPDAFSMLPRGRANGVAGTDARVVSYGSRPPGVKICSMALHTK